MRDVFVAKVIAWTKLHFCKYALGAGVEQQIDCFIIQNSQAVQSKGRSVYWTLEDMVGAMIFCTTLASRRSGHTPLAEAGAETSDIGAEVVEPI